MLPDFVWSNLRQQLNIQELHIFQTYLLTELSNTSSDARDWMVTFPTGSGKTLAYLLPLIGRLTTNEDNRPKFNTAFKIKRRSLRAMVVLPTRDLVEQVAHVLGQLLTGFEGRLRFAMCHGGQSFKEEQKLLVASQGNLSFLNDLLHEDLTNTGQSLCDYNYRLPSSSLIDLLITTPGRLLEHLAETESFLLDDLEVIILDEVDRLLASDFGEWLSIIYRKSTQRCSSQLNCRKWLFSATSIHDPAKLATLGLSKDLKYLRVNDMKKMEISNNSSKKFKRTPENSTIEGSRIIEALDSPKDDIDGSKVGEVYWKENDVERILCYNMF